MSDERLRELERRWRASGSAADEAVWLLESVRRGAIGEDRVALAAALGHPGALEALAALRPAASPPQEVPAGLSEAGREAWLQLRRAPPAVDLDPELLTRESAARMRLAALSVLLPTWQARIPAQLANETGSDAELVRAVDPLAVVGRVREACRAWCLDPEGGEACSSVRAELVRIDELLERARQAPEDWDWQTWPEGLGEPLITLLEMARTDCATICEEPERFSVQLGGVRAEGDTWLPFVNEGADVLLDVAAAQREQVAPWLLGEGDPLREPGPDPAGADTAPSPPSEPPSSPRAPTPHRPQPPHAGQGDLRRLFSAEGLPLLGFLLVLSLLAAWAGGWFG